MNADPRAETLRAGPTSPSAAGPLSALPQTDSSPGITTAPTRFGKTSERGAFGAHAPCRLMPITPSVPTKSRPMASAFWSPRHRDNN
jgi:hypothetical protein